MGVKHVTTGYSPRPLQLELHRSFRRFNVVVCHRRFGKTHLAVNEAIDRALRCELDNPQYAYIAPTYSQAKRIVWDILKSYLKDIPGVTVNEAELRIDIPRPNRKDKVRFLLLGAENFDSIRGIYLDGVIFDEYAEMDPQIWSMVVRPALSDRVGWAIFIGTPKGQNHFYRLIQAYGDSPDWFIKIYKASETGVLPTAELEAARQVMSDEEYDQEYECSFAAALVGSYYGKQIEKLEKEGKITAVPYERGLPVYTYWDLGISDTMSIWFAQRIGGQIRWIDYHEESGKDIPHYAKVLKEKGYLYEEHVLPHDAKVRSLNDGKTREHTLRDLCPGVRVRVLAKQPVGDGINAVRMMLAKSVFDKARCNMPWGKDQFRGLESLRNYQKIWDAKNSIFQDNPKHDWASHGADSFRTAAMAMREAEVTTEDKKKYPRHSQREFSVV